MNRKTFLASIAAIFAAPFVGKAEEPEPKLPIGYGVITPEVMEEFVKKAIDHRLRASIYRNDGDGYKLVNRIYGD